jgi:hypothetical protein
MVDSAGHEHGGDDEAQEQQRQVEERQEERQRDVYGGRKISRENRPVKRTRFRWRPSVRHGTNRGFTKVQSHG